MSERGVGNPFLNDWCGKQTEELGYLQWHADAERRAETGEVQSYCLTCHRYRWPDLLCEDAETEVEAISE